MGTKYETHEEYEEALRTYPPFPVTPSQVPANEGARINVGETCPTCGLADEVIIGKTYVPSGCYVPYSGRRADCYSFWGRVLTEEEKQAILEWEANHPLPPRVELQNPNA
jgi:hypothetical protein